MNSDETLNTLNKIETLEQLEHVYSKPSEASLWKEVDFLSEHYQAFIKASPFLILATQGDKGLDCSPRGDPAGFVRILNDKTILIPDRKGNNRLDSLRNIVTNPNVALIFMVPNAGETIRVSGIASILVNKDLCESFTMNGKPASSVISVTVQKAYFQCQKAIARSKLWDATTYQDRQQLPSAGDMVQHFAKLRKETFDGEQYDKGYPERMKKTMY